ncbi:RNA-directed DNA polymerase [Solimicrobium silvestre]|uniref:Reverse transcriptase (RNA-dependent DNA polymerase) n=1 Tax=Solimicrobium silvestre TaxID=2099400 RepID=A0A2S9GY26_9BURK|nr:RNA-directed DNA polymerase [Solimicrobium silvestre]PRC92625.1 Reverse transcriptase (RNA-dependent DNA polymerase) [Solimicrobium silvestre]
MINKGDFLESPAMRSFGAATGIRTTMPASSISTTTVLTTRTTTSASADPIISRLGTEHAHVKPTIIGRKSPGDTPKARQFAKPKTVAGLTSAATEGGNESIFHQLTSLDSLYQYWLKAKKNKSKSLRVQRFGDDPLRYLVMIQNRLRDREYTFGPYKSFTVREKKFRHVVDAPMKDRVVHWMLYDYLLPIWQPRFIHDTYGNLPRRGTHAAVNRLAQFCRGADSKWVLQLDISKYFYSVNHEILKARALRFIGDHDLRVLMIALIDSFATDSQYDDLFPADGMYRTTAAKGMPIGNLSSQLFANIFLNDFDHWVKEVLRIKLYIRYVDDMVILADSKEELATIRDLIVQKLALDGLTIHPKKIRLAPATAGIPFLGYIVWPNHISAGSYVRGRYLHRVRQHERDGYDKTEALAAYSAMFKHTGSTIYREAA